MTEVRRWLDTRRPEPPPALGERVRSAVAAAASGQPSPSADAVAGTAADRGGAALPAAAETLARAALDRLVAVLASDGGRDDALDLLAADALLTYAAEAAAEAGPEAVEAFVRAYAPERLAGLLEADGRGR